MSALLAPKMKTRWVTAPTTTGGGLYPVRVDPSSVLTEEVLPSRQDTDGLVVLPESHNDQRAKRSPVLRLDAFLAEDYPALRWRIERLLPAEGFSVLLGKEKSGKSFFSQQQALCIAAGVPFLGQPTTKARVLLIEEEGSKRMMKDRIERQADGLGIDTKGLELFPMVRERLRLETEGDQDYLRSVIEDHQAQVVILGPLAQLFSLDDENAAAEMSKVTRFMNDLAAEASTVVQLAHHMNKNVNVNGGRAQFFNGARGSSALMGAVDASVGLGRKEGDKTGSLHLLLRDDEGWSFRFRWDGDRVLFVPDDSAGVVDDESTVTESVPHGEDATCLSLLTFLAENPWKSCPAVEKDSGIASKNTVRRHLDGMVPDLVQKDKDGKADLYALAGETSQPPTV